MPPGRGSRPRIRPNCKPDRPSPPPPRWRALSPASYPQSLPLRHPVLRESTRSVPTEWSRHDDGLTIARENIKVMRTGRTSWMTGAEDDRLKAGRMCPRCARHKQRFADLKNVKIERLPPPPVGQNGARKSTAETTPINDRRSPKQQKQGPASKTHPGPRRGILSVTDMPLTLRQRPLVWNGSQRRLSCRKKISKSGSKPSSMVTNR